MYMGPGFTELVIFLFFAACLLVFVVQALRGRGEKNGTTTSETDGTNERGEADDLQRTDPYRKHVKGIAVFWIVASIMAAIAVSAEVVGEGTFLGDPTEMCLSLFAVNGVSGCILLGGILTLQRRKAGRVTMFILAAISLFYVPLGTLLGIYMLFCLIKTGVEWR